MSRDRKKASFEEFDWHLLATALVLSLIGLVFVWSTTHDDESAGLLPRQLLFVGAALPLVAVAVRFPYPTLGRLVVPAYAVCVALLVYQLLGGADEARNTQSWIRLPLGFKLQPSEFAKLAVVLMLAAWLRHRPRPKRLVDLVGPFALACFPAVLIAQQPDLGSAVLLLPVLFAMLFCAGTRLALLLGIGGAGVALAVLLYFSPFLHDYQRARILGFFQSIPEQTAKAKDLRAAGEHEEARHVEHQLRALKQGTNFQVYHSMISIGSGGLIGRGIGRGPHNRLDYLPERHNDFIFAVVGEEWGFLGSSIVLGLYFLLVALTLGVARWARAAVGP
ncbi:MAG: FtsW/RodA/SpoVE family cell cycle protein, partial [Planctomycetota bacterium JB042]